MPNETRKTKKSNNLPIISYDFPMISVWLDGLVQIKGHGLKRGDSEN